MKEGSLTSSWWKSQRHIRKSTKTNKVVSKLQITRCWAHTISTTGEKTTFARREGKSINACLVRIKIPSWVHVSCFHSESTLARNITGCAIRWSGDKSLPWIRKSMGMVHNVTGYSLSCCLPIPAHGRKAKLSVKCHIFAEVDSWSCVSLNSCWSERAQSGWTYHMGFESEFRREGMFKDER